MSAAPGLRVPGAWDGFETAVRAVLGDRYEQGSWLVADADGLHLQLGN